MCPRKCLDTSAFPAAVVALLVLSAGCTGVSGLGGSSTTSPSPTATPTPADTGPQTSETPTTTTSSPVGQTTTPAGPFPVTINASNDRNRSGSLVLLISDEANRTVYNRSLEIGSGNYRSVNVSHKHDGTYTLQVEDDRGNVEQLEYEPRDLDTSSGRLIVYMDSGPGVARADELRVAVFYTDSNDSNGGVSETQDVTRPD